MSFSQVITSATPTPVQSSDCEINGVLPNGGLNPSPAPPMNPGLMTPHDQRRRAALLADSPELSSRPPLNAGGGSGSILGMYYIHMCRWRNLDIPI